MPSDAALSSAIWFSRNCPLVLYVPGAQRVRVLPDGMPRRFQRPRRISDAGEFDGKIMAAGRKGPARELGVPNEQSPLDRAIQGASHRQRSIGYELRPQPPSPISSRETGPRPPGRL